MLMSIATYQEKSLIILGEFLRRLGKPHNHNIDYLVASCASTGIYILPCYVAIAICMLQYYVARPTTAL